jgi:hypothetical protein
VRVAFIFARREKFVERPVVHPAESELGGYRPYQREEHIPLGVPHVALCSEKCISALAAGERGSPLNEFVASTEGQTNCRNKNEQPPASSERRGSQQNLAHEDSRDEALREVAEAVVVIARKPEELLYPESERYPCVGLVTAHHEYERMDRQ